MTDPSPDDTSDVLRAQRGDEAAFGRLVERYARRVHDLARRMLRDPHEAEDVVQHAFLNAWKALDRFDPDRPFRNWLLRIASNLCRNRLQARMRRARRELPARGGEEPLPDQAARPAAAPKGAEGAPAAVRDAIQALPERYRLPVILHYVQGLPLAAVAEITETPVPTVKTHLHRGRAALRRLLAPQGEAGETPPPTGGTTR